VGTAWLLARTGARVDVLRPHAGEVPVRHAEGLTFICARPEWAPEFGLVRLSSPDEVDALDGPPGGSDLGSAWAWLDEPAGLVRARVFASRLGIAEDEATGAAAVRLGAVLGRPIEIRQGRGSLIRVRPAPGGMVEIGGVVVLDERRDYSVSGANSGS